MTALSRESAEVRPRGGRLLSRIVNGSRAREASYARARARLRVRTPYWLVVAVVFGDMVAVGVALLASQMIFPMTQFPHVLYTASGAALAWPILLTLRGSYTATGLAARDAGKRLATSAVLLVALFALIAAALEQTVPRTTVLVVAPLVLAISFATRRLVVWRTKRLRRAGVDLRRVIAVGPGRLVSDFVDQLATETDHPIVVVGACTEGGDLTEDIPVAAKIDPEGGWPDPDHPRPSDPAVAAVVDAVCQYNTDTVCVVAGSGFAGRRLQALIWALADHDVDVLTAPGLMDISSHRVSLDRAGAVSLLHVRPVPTSSVRRLGKAMFDRMAAAALLTVFAVPMLLIAVAVRTTSAGPAFFKQARLGKNGQSFMMYKFRSMVTDAEVQRDDLMPSNDHAGGVMFKLRNDPRVTRVGGFLRHWSIDELPQLINVLRGEMSLVGPRPPLPDEVAKYGEVEFRRLRVKPGMTGLWQVSGRSNLTWDETLRLDLRYVDNWSLTADLRLLWRTAGAVLRGTGAY